MKNRAMHISRLACCLAVFFLQWGIAPAQAADGPAGSATGTEQELLRLGESIYFNGTLASGEPVQAKVFGDVTVAGQKVACAACHLRSGLGFLLNEETLVLPVSGTKLYAPLLDQYDIPGTTMKRTMFENPRPAYTDDTLVAAILHGKDPAGRVMKEEMPRYLLDAASAKAMVSYLKHLSAKLSPGLAEDEIRFATIITDGIAAADREAMVRPLTAFLQEEWNGRLSVLAKRSNIRVAQGDRPLDKEKRYRRASLDIWELHGPAETWTSQLETFYRQRPAFAVLGGLAAGDWSPIHRFCEKNKIPSIFPITELPALSAGDWYTLYLSKGFYLEGEVAARFLARDAGLASGTPVVQVLRPTDQGRALAHGFAETWNKLNGGKLTEATVATGEQSGRELWKKLAAANPGAVLVAWLEAADLAGIEALADHKPPALFVSGTLLGEALPTLPEPIRDFTYIGYPTRLPGDGEYTESIVAGWLKMKKIPVTNIAISSKVYLLKSMLAMVMMEMGGDFYRDFFLDIFDGAMEQTTSSATYPLLTFGPGDRYAAKGCNVVQLAAGEKPKLVKKVDWLHYARRE